MSAGAAVRHPAPSPCASGDLVARPRLISMLDDAMRLPATAIYAPAGYGKTVLLAEWVRRRGIAPAWVNLDERHADSAKFWNDVCSALRTAAGAAASATDASHSIGGGDGPDGECAAADPTDEACAIAASADKDVLLVLDDYQCVPAASSVHAQVGLLLRTMPSTLHVVVLARAFPRIGLAKLRASGALLEIGIRDLAFTDLEVHDFLTRVEMKLAAEQEAEVKRQLGGWPAGACMLARAWYACNGTSLEAANELLEQFVRDYIEEEVLAGVSSDMRAFLATASYLDTFTAGLVAAVVGIDEREALLLATRAADEGLFVSDAGMLDGEPAFELHPLVAHVLERRAVAYAAPDRATALVAASAWYEKRGDFDGAVRMAARAHDWDYITSIIMRTWRSYYASDSMRTLRDWLTLMPAAYIEAHPGLCLVMALPLAAVGQHEDARGALRLARLGIRSQEDEKMGQYQAMCSITCSVLGEAATAEEAGRAALAVLPESEEYLRAMVQQVLGGVLQVKDPLASREMLRRALATQRHLGMANPLCSVYANLAAVSAYMGECGDAKLYAEHAMEVFPRTMHRERPMLDMAYAAHAQALYAMGDIDGARADIGYLESRGESVRLSGAIAGYLVAALIARLSGDTQAEQGFVRGAYAHSPAGLMAALPPLSALSAWIASGVLSARELREVADEIADGKPTGLLMRALLNAAEGVRGVLSGVEAAQLAKLLEGIPLFYIRAQLLAAQAYEAEDVPEKADASLRRALSVAQPLGLSRVFLDDAEYILPAWRRVAAEAPASWSAQLLKCVSSHAAPHVSRDALRSLTEREMDVVRLAADGLSVQQIADRLFLSRETAKKHLSNVYGKLGVHSKGQAVALLRQLDAL